MFPKMFECAEKFIPFTPYLFVSFMIFVNFYGSLHFGLPLCNQHGDPQFFRIFSNDIPIYTFCENFIKIIWVHLPKICSGMTIMTQTAKYGIGYFYM